jgi:hypothetical protein
MKKPLDGRTSRYTNSNFAIVFQSIHEYAESFDLLRANGCSE